MELSLLTDHKPTDEFKNLLKRAFGTFLINATGSHHLSNNIEADEVDLLIRLTRNFCKSQNIGTRWVNNHLVPALKEGKPVKNRTYIDKTYYDIVDIFTNKVLDRYTSDDPFNFYTDKQRTDEIVRFCYHKCEGLEENFTYVLTLDYFKHIIKFLGMEEYQEELLNMARSELKYIVNNYDKTDDGLKQAVEHSLKVSKENDTEYIGVVKREDITDLNEFYTNKSMVVKDEYNYFSISRINAYEKFSIVQIREHYSAGMWRF